MHPYLVVVFVAAGFLSLMTLVAILRLPKARKTLAVSLTFAWAAASFTVWIGLWALHAYAEQLGII